MGAVWIARNLATGADVAIKVLHPGQGDAEAAERFRHEARLGAMLGHRNITRVFDLLEDNDGSLVLVMELLRGETLEGHLRAKGPLSGKDAVALLVPILSGLQHAHDHGVVHRDLKPSNIFVHVDPDGQATPKLLDFGIAKLEQSNIHTRTGDVLGTPSYMSPEQVRASNKLDGRSDLFSVGVVLYEIITGENPFGAPVSSAALARVLELEIDPDPRLEPRLWMEVQRALSKQAYERHASASELARALCAAVGESEVSLAQSLRREPPPARVEEPRTPARPWPTHDELDEGIEAAPRPRSGRRVLTAAAAGLVVLAGLFLYLQMSRPPPPRSVASEPPVVSGSTALATASPIATPSQVAAGSELVTTPAAARPEVPAPIERSAKRPPQATVPAANKPVVGSQLAPWPSAEAAPAIPATRASSKSVARSPGF